MSPCVFPPYTQSEVRRKQWRRCWWKSTHWSISSTDGESQRAPYVLGAMKRLDNIGHDA